MHIAVNTRLLLADRLEGIGWFTHEILRRWVCAHPEHTFYFLFDRKPDPAFIFADNVKPVVLFPPRGIRFCGIGFSNGVCRVS